MSIIKTKNDNFKHLIETLSNQFLTVFTTVLVGFFLNVLIARSIGPEEFGTYTSALTFGMFAVVFIDGGFGKLLHREITSPSPHITLYQNNLHGNAIAHALIATLIIIIVVAFFSQNLIIFLTLMYFLLITLNGHSHSILRGRGQLIKDAMLQTYYRLFLFAVLSIGLVFLSIQTASTVMVAYLFSLFIFILLISKSYICKPIFVIPLGIYKSLIPLIIIDLMAVIYLRSNLLILDGLEVSKTEIGYYSAAFKFVEMGLYIILPINLIVFNRLRILRNNNEISKKIVLYLGLTLISSIVFASALAYYGDLVISLVYGQKYLDALNILKILTLSIMLLIPNSMMSQILLAINLEKYYATIITLAAVCNILMNLKYVPVYGVIGSAWISVAIESMIFISYCLVLLLHFYRKNLFGNKSEHA